MRLRPGRDRRGEILVRRWLADRQIRSTFLTQTHFSFFDDFSKKLDSFIIFLEKSSFLVQLSWYVIGDFDTWSVLISSKISLISPRDNCSMFNCRSNSANSSINKNPLPKCQFHQKICLHMSTVVCACLLHTFLNKLLISAI